MLQIVAGCYGTFASIAEALEAVEERYETLRSIAGHYGTLSKRCGSLWNVTGGLRSHYKTLQNHYGKY